MGYESYFNTRKINNFKVQWRGQLAHGTVTTFFYYNLSVNTTKKEMSTLQSRLIFGL